MSLGKGSGHFFEIILRFGHRNPSTDFPYGRKLERGLLFANLEHGVHEVKLLKGIDR